MAEGPRGLEEFLLGRGIVQINVMLVRQHELHLAKGILGARTLAEGEGEISPAIGVPIDAAPG